MTSLVNKTFGQVFGTQTPKRAGVKKPRKRRFSLSRPKKPKRKL